MGLMIGGVSASGLILDGQSVPLYIGGSPPVKVWPTGGAVQITLGDLLQARDQFRAAMTARGLDYQTATEIPFDIELVGTGSARNMFQFCGSLTHAPDLDTSGVTGMNSMFRNCSSLTDGNVRLIGRHPQVSTSATILGSGLTRLPFYDTNGNPI